MTITTPTWARTERGWRRRIAIRSVHVSTPTRRWRQIPAFQSSVAPPAIQTRTMAIRLSCDRDWRAASRIEIRGTVRSEARSTAPLYPWQDGSTHYDVAMADGHIEVN